MQDEETRWDVPPRKRRAPQYEEVTGVSLTRIDVPFVQLTLFFVKASLSLALAMTLTSAVWVVVGGIIAGVTVGGWLALTAAFGPIATVPVAPGTPASAHAPVPAVAPPAPEPEQEPEPEPELPPDPIATPAPEPGTAAVPRAATVQESDAATDAILRAELERMRQRKGR